VFVTNSTPNSRPTTRPAPARPGRYDAAMVENMPNVLALTTTARCGTVSRPCHAPDRRSPHLRTPHQPFHRRPRPGRHLEMRALRQRIKSEKENTSKQPSGRIAIPRSTRKLVSICLRAIKAPTGRQPIARGANPWNVAARCGTVSRPCHAPDRRSPHLRTPLHPFHLRTTKAPTGRQPIARGANPWNIANQQHQPQRGDTSQ